DVRNLRRTVLILHEIKSLAPHGAANSHNLYAIVEHLVGLQRDPGFQYLPDRVFTQTSLAVVAGAVFVSWTIGAGGHVQTYFLSAFDPVGGYLALGGLEIQLPDAYESVEFPLERIFRVGVPR